MFGIWRSLNARQDIAQLITAPEVPLDFLCDIILIFSPMADIISSLVKTMRRHARNHSADQWALA